MSVRTPMGAWTALAREPRRPEATPRARPRRLCTALDLREGGVIPPAEEEWVDSEFPMIAAEDRGDVRVAWMDNRTERWNTWYRPSADGGRTWSGSVRLSDRPDGAPYKSSRGFRYPYGDYGQLAVGGHDRTHAAWGEGPSYAGPGGAWYTRGPIR